jgi:hypothetical protein
MSSNISKKHIISCFWVKEGLEKKPVHTVPCWIEPEVLTAVDMNAAIHWFLVRPIFNPEGGDNTILWKVSSHTDYKALHPKKWQHLVACWVFACQSLAMKTQVISSFEMSADFYQTTRHYVPEERTPHSQQCESLKSQIRFIVLYESRSYVLYTKNCGWLSTFLINF